MPPTLTTTMTTPTLSPAAPAVPPLVRSTQAIAVASLLALIALGLAWELWLAPLRPGGSWWALKVLPLAIPLGGLLKRRLYTYRWLSLAVWLYVTEGLVRGPSESGLGSVLAWLQVVLCAVLFTACTVNIRTRLKAGKAPTHLPPSETA